MSPHAASPRLMPALLLAALLFIAPSGPTYARSRSFQMAMWAVNDSTPGSDTDIPVFYESQAQPAGNSILIRFDINKPISANEYAWSRIAAVLIDEPYNDFNQMTCWSKSTAAAVEARAQLLAQRAAELKSVAPSTRFWVNLARPQLDWMMKKQCVADPGVTPVNVNRPYIDVISVDIYHTRFKSGVRKYYDRLDQLRAKPEQQVALMPGTFFRESADSPATQASYLRGYFDYANKANRRCNLPYGSGGATGSFDGCRVWIVLGWLSQDHTEGGYTYRGERSPASRPIADAWQAQLALPLRRDLASARARAGT